MVQVLLDAEKSKSDFLLRGEDVRIYFEELRNLKCLSKCDPDCTIVFYFAFVCQRFRFLFVFPCQIHLPVKQKSTALWYAVEEGRGDFVNALLDAIIRTSKQPGVIIDQENPEAKFTFFSLIFLIFFMHQIIQPAILSQ